MKCRSFKILREVVEKISSVKSNATFEEAVPVLVELTTKISQMRKTIKSMADLADALNEKVTAYAMAHPSVFVNGLSPADGKMIRHGDVMIGGKLYHFAAGYKGFLRLDGGQLTQEFLDGLPKGWAKGKFEIDATEMKSLGVTDDDLQKAGLVRRANNVWSLPDPADAAEGGE